MAAVLTAAAGAPSIRGTIDGGGGLSAQTSPYVLTSDPAYRDLDVLVTNRWVDPPILSHRPYSRRTFARLARDARRRLEARSPDVRAPGSADVPRLNEALTRLETRFAAEVARLQCEETGRVAAECSAGDGIVRLRSGTVDLVGADSPTRDAREPQPSQRQDAQLNPLLQRNQGRPLHDGFNVAGELSLDLQLHRNVAGQFTGRLRGSLDEPAGADAVEATLTTGYLRSVWGKAYVDLGRVQTTSGVAAELTPILSTNPRAITMIRIGNERPGRLPWILGSLGPSSFRFSLGTLGDDRYNPGSILTTLEASFRPHPDVEFGGSLLSEQGGANTPEVAFWRRLVDTFGFVLYRRPFYFFDAVKGASNKLLGLHGRWRLPAIPATLFVEFTTEDDHDLFNYGNQGYWMNAAWVWGAEARGIGPDGRFDLRIAALHNGPIVSSHGTLRSGLTLDGRTLGSPLGPEAAGVDARLDWFGSTDRLTLTTAFERYSGDDYDRRQAGAGRDRIADNPDELRYRAVAEWLRGGQDVGLYTSIRVGAEHVIRYDFGPENRTNLLGQLSMGYRW